MTYLIDNVLVSNQPAGLVGPKKSLKTNISIDLAVSLATGGRFLGYFNVPQSRRVALHLQYRAEVAGTEIAPVDLCAGWRYGLSHARRYQVALGDEPQRMATRIIAEIAEANRILEVATDRYDAKVEPLGDRLKEIASFCRDAEKARHELYSTCRDPELVRQLDEVSRPLDKASRRLSQTKTDIHNLRCQSSAEREGARLAVREPKVEYHAKEAEQCETKVKQLERELPALRRQAADLERQDAEIRQKMLER